MKSIDTANAYIRWIKQKVNKEEIEMKHIIILATLFGVLTFASFSEGVEPLPDGFSGIKFGSSVPEKLKNHARINVSNNNKNYSFETGWRETFLGTDVKEVDLKFINDKFYSVTLEAVGIDTEKYKKLISNMSERFGPPLISGSVVQGETIHVWEQGDKSIRFHAPIVSDNMILLIDISQFLPDMRCPCIK